LNSRSFATGYLISEKDRRAQVYSPLLAKGAAHTRMRYCIPISKRSVRNFFELFIFIKQVNPPAILADPGMKHQLRYSENFLLTFQAVEGSTGLTIGCVPVEQMSL